MNNIFKKKTIYLGCADKRKDNTWYRSNGTWQKNEVDRLEMY